MSLDASQKGWVVLTVPHAVCPPDYPLKTHKCDVLAKEAADCLHKASNQVKNNKIVVLEPFIPDTPRSVCDLNRYWCDPDKQTKSARDHPYRKQLREFVTKHNAIIIFVLDIHSYPEDVDNKWKEYELVLIVDSYASYAVDFVKFMNRAEIFTLLQPGKNNDLHVEMRTQLGKKSMLLEFNEKLTKERDRMEFICRLVVVWLNKFRIE